MAALTGVHWEAITPEMREIIRFIGECAFASRFYLAGGTALALRLGYRYSVDLDFFSNVDEIGVTTRHEIVNALASLHLQVLEDVDGNLLLQIGNVHVGFFGYDYPLVALTDDVDGVALAGVLDIALMKLDALISRGSRKDFYDLYFILQQVSLAEILDLGRVKYPYARDFELMAVESLVLFDNADRDIQPRLLVDVAWDQVRQFFIDEAQLLGHQWLDAQ